MEFRKGLGVVLVIVVGVKFGLLPSRAPYYLVRQILFQNRENPRPPLVIADVLLKDSNYDTITCMRVVGI